MSELFDDEPEDLPPHRSSRRVVWIVGVAVVLVLAFFALTTFASIDTDRLWFASVQESSVWRRLFWTRTILFVAGALLMAAIVGGSMVLAFASRPFYHPADEHGALARYRDAVDPVRRWLLIGIAGLCGIFAGVATASSWRTWMLWRNAVPWGRTDPWFHKDVSFYVFDLPWWHDVVNFALTALVLSVLASLAVHYLYGGIRLSTERDRFSRPAQAQLSVLIALLLAVKALDTWLGRYDLVHSDGPLFTGIGYTDDHAVLPGKEILTVVTLICAALFLLNLWRRSWLAPVTSVATLLVCTIILALIWPVIVQSFEVKPSQADKEASYLAENIAATRTAYDIASADGQPYTGTTSTSTGSSGKALAQELDADAAGVPVVDPTLAGKEFQQTQQYGKGYYSTAPDLDVDHYTINGTDRPLDLAVRELDQSGLPSNARTWTNLHTVYTHGDGVVASYADQRDASGTSEEVGTQYAVGDGHNDLEPFQRQVYFGEDSPDYSVVGGSSTPVEADIADDGSTDTTTYAGSGGVPLSSGFRRFLYAVRFSSTDLMLSQRVTDDSRILYDRTPLERVKKVAPWLTLDDDPYPVVVDGRLQWVVDGYTTTDLYPGSQRDSLAAMTSSASSSNPDQPAFSDDQVNYVRDAVKATVDAYDGTVTLYAWDTSDPILKTWEAAFPGLVKSKADIPPDLLPHLRYPTGLFDAQRFQLARYHVTDPVQFLTNSDRWDVPDDPNNAGSSVASYRTFLDDDGRSTWSLATTFVPYQKQNLAALMTVDSDPTSPGYGRIRLLTGFSAQTPGPAQVQQDFATNTDITDRIARFSRSASSPSYGNILMTPTPHGLLAIEPVYVAQSATAGYPVLAYVLVSYGSHAGIGATLSEALSNALTASGGSQPGQPVDKRATTLLTQVQQLWSHADAAAEAGNTARAHRLESQARDKLAQALTLLGSASK